LKNKNKNGLIIKFNPTENYKKLYHHLIFLEYKKTILGSAALANPSQTQPLFWHFLEVF
jgi:hypothetical protein